MDPTQKFGQPASPSPGPLKPVEQGPAPLRFGEASAPKQQEGPKPFDQIVPVSAVGDVLGHIPFGWVPGGADDQFKKLGEWMQANDPEAYKEWQTVKMTSDADLLGGGEAKANFNREWTARYDAAKYDSAYGAQAEGLRNGLGASGSVGQALWNWVMEGAFGSPSQASMRTQAGIGNTDPNSVDLSASTSGGHDSELVRQYGALDRLARAQFKIAHPEVNVGEPISDVEQTAVKNFEDGTWSREHALDSLTIAHEAASTNPLDELITELGTDPLLYATAGAGLITKGVSLGARLVEAGKATEDLTMAERLAKSMYLAKQKPLINYASKATYTLIDPFSLIPHSSASEGLKSISSDLVNSAFDRGFGATDEVARQADALGLEQEVVGGDIGAYSYNQAKLHVANAGQDRFLGSSAGGTEMRTVTPDEYVADVQHVQPRDIEGDLADAMYKTSKKSFNDAELEQLARRGVATYGNSLDAWRGMLAKSGDRARSVWHALTYQGAYRQFREAIGKVQNYAGDLDLGRLVLVNDQTLTDVSAKDIIASLEGTDDLATKGQVWELASEQYPGLVDVSVRAPRDRREFQVVIDRLQRRIDEGSLVTQAPDGAFADPALHSINEFLDAHTVEGERLWSVGFQPKASEGWGINNNPFTGELERTRVPFITHSTTAVPHSPTMGQVTRNYAGQIIGDKAAMGVSKPVDSLAGFLGAMKDNISYARVATNRAARFERSMVQDLGVDRKLSNRIYQKAQEFAGLQHIQIAGVRPTDDFWSAIDSVIPRGYRLADGTALNRHIVLDHLLRAAGGDMRVVGVLPKAVQSTRAAVSAGLDHSNYLGTVTSTFYNNARYVLNPTYLIQVITDSGFFGAMAGSIPVLGRKLPERLGGVRTIEEMMGHTSVARDLAMDMQEYTVLTRTEQNLTDKVVNRLGSNVNKRMGDVSSAVNDHIATNMTNQMGARLGSTLREAIDELPEAIKAYPEEQQAEMLDAVQNLLRNMASWRAIYSKAAGRVLTDDEVGMQFIIDHILSKRRQVIGADGLPNLDEVAGEATWHTPDDVGEIQTFHPDAMAQRLDFRDGHDLRRAISGYTDREGLEHPPTYSIDQLASDLAAQNIHPDVIRRAKSYWRETWDDFWSRLQTKAEDGGIALRDADLQPVQDLVVRMATARNMDPWEFVSQVMFVNLRGESPEDALLAWVKAGASDAPQDALVRLYQSSMDLSQQDALLRAFREDTTKLEESIAAGPQGQAVADATTGEVNPDVYASQGRLIDQAESRALRARAAELQAARQPARHPVDLKAALDKPSADQAVRQAPEASGYTGADGEVLKLDSSGDLGVDVEDVSPDHAPRNLLPSRPKGKPGISLEPKSGPDDSLYVFRDEEGKPVGYARIGGKLGATEAEAHAAPTAVHVYVDEAHRRQGIATKLYDHLRAEGWDVQRVSGKTVTAEGRAFTGAYWKPEPPKPRTIADDLYERTALKKWGGASYSPRTGQFIEDANPFLYHGTQASNEAGIAENGLSGTFTTDAADRAIPKGDSTLIYRTRKIGQKWSADKFPEWQRGRGIKPENLEVSRDGGKTWEPVVEGTNPSAGPWVGGSSQGKTVSISIEDAQDPVKFREALDRFVEENDEALQIPGNYIGTFRDDQEGVVQFDVAVATFNQRDTEALQLAEGRAGGAYDTSTGNGLFAPRENVDADPEAWTPDFGRDERQDAVFPEGFAPEEGYVYRVGAKRYELQGGAVPETGWSRDPDPVYAEKDNAPIYRMRERPDMQPHMNGYDLTNTGTILPEEIEVLTEKGWRPLPPNPYDEELRSGLVRRVQERAASGVPDLNPEVEGFFRAYMAWLKEATRDSARSDLKYLFDAIPDTGGWHYNRSEQLVQDVITNKIRLNRSDVFRLAEMSTNRTGLMRSINHPVFGLYPAAYMWGKVLPETMRFLARNPYGATYAILDVERAIAAQREYDPEMGSFYDNADKSAMAFSLGYATPSLPWEDIAASWPPVLRAIGRNLDDPRAIPGDIWSSLLRQVDPNRWVEHIVEPANEAIDAVGGMFGGDKQQDPGVMLHPLTAPAPSPEAAVPQGGFSGPVPGPALKPVLQDALADLESALG